MQTAKNISLESKFLYLKIITENVTDVARNKLVNKVHDSPIISYLSSVLSSTEIYVFDIFHEKNTQQAARDQKTLCAEKEEKLPSLIDDST